MKDNIPTGTEIKITDANGIGLKVGDVLVTALEEDRGGTDPFHVPYDQCEILE